MALGNESRVGVRVFPDARRFPGELKRFLEKIERTVKVVIPVRLDESRLGADLRRVQADLESSIGRGVDVPVKYDDPGFKPPKPVEIQLDPDMLGFQRRVDADLAALRNRLKTDVEVSPRTDMFRGEVELEIARLERSLSVDIPLDVSERQGFQESVSKKITELNRSFDPDRGNAFTRMLSGLRGETDSVGRSTSVVGRLVDGVGSVFSKVADLGSGLSGSLTTVASVGLKMGAAFAIAIPLVGLLAAGIGILIGAVLALGGAITAGLGGLPVLLTSLLAPIAAVALGMDGIKKAAEVLKEPFDRLRASVSQAFEQGLTPVFERLKAVFPVLETGMVGIADGLSRFAGGMVDVITTSAGLANIERAFTGVQTVIDKATPGASALLTQLLEIAGTSELYDILGNSINGALEGIARFLQRLRPELVPALTQLDSVLRSAGGALGELLIGATQFFTAAGPGLTRFFDGMKVAFSNIDWVSLGDSFGRIFAAIGDGLARVPPETWARLAESVRNFADQVQAFVDNGGIDLMIRGFSFLVDIAGEAISAMLAAGYAIQGLNTLLTSNDFGAAAESFKNAFKAMRGSAEADGQGIVESVTRTSGEAATNFNQNVAKMPLDAANHGAAATAGMQANLAPLPNVVGNIGRDTSNILAGSLGPMPGRAGGIADDTANRVGDGLRRGEPEARSVGSSIMSALSSALNAGGSAVISSAVRVAMAAFNAAKRALGISSPSRMFLWLGEQTIRGFILSIDRGRASVVSSLDRLFGQELQRRLTESARRVDIRPWRALGERIADAMQPGPGWRQAEDGSWVRPGYYAKDRPGWRQAEDGTWVRPGYYAKDRPVAAQPSKHESEDIARAVYQAVMDALSGAELRVHGEGVATLVNDYNLRNQSR